MKNEKLAGRGVRAHLAGNTVTRRARVGPNVRGRGLLPKPGDGASLWLSKTGPGVCSGTAVAGRPIPPRRSLSASPAPPRFHTPSARPGWQNSFNLRPRTRQIGNFIGAEKIFLGKLFRKFVAILVSSAIRRQPVKRTCGQQNRLRHAHRLLVREQFGVRAVRVIRVLMNVYDRLSGAGLRRDLTFSAPLQVEASAPSPASVLVAINSRRERECFICAAKFVQRGNEIQFGNSELVASSIVQVAKKSLEQIQSTR